MALDIQENDDIVFSFKKKTELEIYGDDDIDLENPKIEVFEPTEQIEVTIFGVDEHKYDIQFGDGTIAFVRKNSINIISIN